MTESERALADSDQTLLAALRERVERRAEPLVGPTGETMDEMEVEGLAVLMREWVAKADSADPDLRSEHRMIRERLDAFHAAARAQDLVP